MDAVRAWWLGLTLAGLVSRSALASEASIAVEGPTSGCPPRGDVVAALESRLPGVTRTRAPSQPALRYRLELGRGSGPTGTALRLLDGEGALVLERQLTSSASATTRSPGESCQALAEAAALVVVRYLREIGYRSPTPLLPVEEAPVSPPPAPEPAPAPVRPAVAPPAAPAPSLAATPGPAPSTSIPARRAPAALAASAPPVSPVSVAFVTSRAAPSASAGFLGAAAVVRAGLGSGLPDQGAHVRSEIMVALQASRGRLAGELAAGVSSETTVPVPESSGAADLRLRAFPLRAGLGVPFSALGGSIIPMAGLNLDLLAFRARGLVDPRRGLRFEPVAELGLSYRAAGRRLFARGALWGGFSLAPRDFDAGGSEPVFRTSTASLRVQLEVGLVLWKNGGASTL